MQYFKHAQIPGLFEVLRLPDGRISVARQGGGFARLLTEADFAKEYSPTQPDFSYRSGMVNAEFFDDGVAVACYGNGKRWNGWGMPVFTLEASQALIEYMTELRYDEAQDVFVWEPHDGEVEVYSPLAILVGREAIKVYPIGTGSWCWEEVAYIETVTTPPEMEDKLTAAAPELTVDRDTTVGRMKREVSALTELGTIPDSVSTFADLHAYLDANCLGGFCDDAFSDSLVAHFGGRDHNEGMPEGMLAFINECQGAVDEWLRAMRPLMSPAEAIKSDPRLVQLARESCTSCEGRANQARKFLAKVKNDKNLFSGVTTDSIQKVLEEIQWKDAQ